MIVYFILALLFIVFDVLFIINKFFGDSYKNCPDELAKKYYRIGGIVTSSLLALGFIFMGFYDLTINIDHEIIALEGFGLFLLLFGVIAFIFAVLLYHNRMIEYSKQSAEEKKEVKEEINLTEGEQK
ncbi:MAG: hypothetical protein K6G28_02355 [Acholeplasmatales bacterium]|nr:hypothetical protein [Acholeplasmatales bacterium]